MVVAGDPSGDASAAALIASLCPALAVSELPTRDDLQPLSGTFAPRVFGAGGPKLAQAGADLAFDLTGDAVIGPADLLGKLRLLKLRFDELTRLACERQPDLILLVDYGAFNWRLARAIRARARAGESPFLNWRPKIVQYVSPQVWASRPGRADKMAKDLDLLLCLFPFEKEWYARRVPGMNVAWVGHPLIDRYSNNPAWLKRGVETDPPTILIFPGSRTGELKRHLPVMLGAAQIIGQKTRAQFKMVVDSEKLASMARSFCSNANGASGLEIAVGGVGEALSNATLAITKTGTITMECALFGVPAVAIYKTSPVTYALGRYLTHVKFLSMPNLLANEAVFPEFIQHQATAEKIAASALEILSDPKRRAAVKAKLESVAASLGGPGATARATEAIVKLMTDSGPRMLST
jgi:lipid-A-disaccharide synthase